MSSKLRQAMNELQTARQDWRRATKAYRKKRRELRERRVQGELPYEERLALLDLAREMEVAQRELKAAKARYELEMIGETYG